MKKARYTETQIIKILHEVEGSRLVKEVCREYGISDATYYNWKSKYGGMTARDQSQECRSWVVGLNRYRGSGAPH